MATASFDDAQQKAQVPSLLRVVKGGRKTKVRLLMVGLANAGKATILKALASEDVKQSMPTKGFSVESESVVSKSTQIEVFDNGGKTGAHSGWRNFSENSVVGIRDVDGEATVLKSESVSQSAPAQGLSVKSVQSHGVQIDVFDVGGPRGSRRFWRKHLEGTDMLIYVVDSADRGRLEEAGQQLTDLLEEEKLAGTPLLVLANKQDLTSAAPVQELTGAMALTSIKGRAWSIQPCVAVTGRGLKKGMKWIRKNLKS